MKTKSNFIFLAIIFGLSLSVPCYSNFEPETLQTALKGRIRQLHSKQCRECGGELIHRFADLHAFYRRNNYQPVWSNGIKGCSSVSDLLLLIRSSRNEGLEPENYHLYKIKALLQKTGSESAAAFPGDVSALTDLELLCTDAYLLLASHFFEGRIRPERLYDKWMAADTDADFAAILQEAVNNNSITGSLKQLLPPHAGYSALKKQLELYRSLASEHKQEPIPPGRLIERGDRDSRLPAVQRRLEMLGDLPAEENSVPERYNGRLVSGVISFQKRHGLKADGIVGDRTLAALNLGFKERIRKIKVNLERWRWTPHNLGNRYILVNIADYSLTVVEEGRKVMDMRVVVGRDYRKTPVFNDRLRYIVINPFWNVPRRIAVKDILPKIKEDRVYLDRNNFSILSGWGRSACIIDPQSIDWPAASARSFRYRLRQDPGPANPLGRIKFMFPNKFAVYLHDTPSKRLFGLKRRGYSSGCIRIEKPIDLAEYVLRDQACWSRENLLKAIDTGRRLVLPVKAEIDIHIMYWTAWVDRKGDLQFRKDIYERDRPLSDALNKRLPQRKTGNWSSKRD